ncbi:hypothetical protein B7463_g10653, partial [Scytalidium lignicola]
MPPGGKEPLVDHGCPKVRKKGKDLNEQRTYLLQETEALIEYVGRKPATEGYKDRKARPIPSDNALDFLRAVKSFLRGLKDDGDGHGGHAILDTTNDKLDEMRQDFRELRDQFNKMASFIQGCSTRSGSPQSTESS